MCVREDEKREMGKPVMRPRFASAGVAGRDRQREVYTYGERKRKNERRRMGARRGGFKGLHTMTVVMCERELRLCTIAD